MLGCKKKAYQETKREIWAIDKVDIMMDEWPFLKPFVEIEGYNEESVKAVAQKLGFDYSDARFCSVDTIYAEKYNISKYQINNKTPKIVFDMENPFNNLKNSPKHKLTKL